MSQFESPVLFLVFNRPNLTKLVFERIRQAKPKRLYISADGPRKEFPNEEHLCNQVRQIVTSVDWECDLKTRFLDENFGCQRAVSSGISWLFESEEQGIILEDDCLPQYSFFLYCQYLLEKYRDEKEVMHIGGYNPVHSSFEEDYNFMGSASIWGWATWKRSWSLYDQSMKGWPSLRKEKEFLLERFGNILKLKQVIANLDRAHQFRVNTWDYQWNYTILLNKGFAIIPNKNQIQNIGFGRESTHTNNVGNLYSNVQSFEISFPMKAPESVTLNRKYVRSLYRIDVINLILQKLNIIKLTNLAITLLRKYKIIY